LVLGKRITGPPNQPGVLLADERPRCISRSEQRAPAVRASEIGALSHRAGYFDFASLPAWMMLEIPLYSGAILKKTFVAG
jgi:hypothetical protein